MVQETEKLIREIQKGLIKWYPFEKEDWILYVGTKESACYELLASDLTCGKLCCATVEQTMDLEWRRNYLASFDKIISITDLEREGNPQEVLESWKLLLKPNGCLLLGMNNRFGIRYFCGDRDLYTNRNFDGIENYRRAAVKKEDVLEGRMYTKAEIGAFLEHAGFLTHKFYSIFPDLGNPSFFYSEEFLPNEELNTRCFPYYHSPDTVFLEEEFLYTDLIKNGMFHAMANAYLVECYVKPDAEVCDVLHVTASMDRGTEDALFTIIHKDGMVEKRAAYEEGIVRFEQLLQNSERLKKHGVSVVDAKMVGNSYQMPYVEGENALLYLRSCAKTDLDAFIFQMDRFRDVIMQSSEQIELDGEVCFRHGYLDMVPINCFVVDGEFVFYDQEFCAENCPVGVVVGRLVDVAYNGQMELQKKLPADFFFKRYGIADKLDAYRRYAWEFLSDLRKEKALFKYYDKHRRNPDIVNSNRQRMNFSAAEYQRLFVDVFRNVENRKLFLFGSGKFAEKFMMLYGKKYAVTAILDNNKARVGETLAGVAIQSPDVLRGLEHSEYKVIICIKNYLSVVKQLEEMGVTNYCIYDPNKNYPSAKRELLTNGQPLASGQSLESGQTGTPEQSAGKKKYHKGYIAGVFDLFHVGHLNMFKRAKEQCEYLIVGVVSDEGVRKYKKKEAFIPFEERIEIVRSCRYVDEAVEIPLNFGGTKDAYRMYEFDCQFSGSDYVNDEGWLMEKEFLEKQGAEMVFFPYTQSTNSTQIRKLIMDAGKS